MDTKSVVDIFEIYNNAIAEFKKTWLEVFRAGKRTHNFCFWPFIICAKSLSSRFGGGRTAKLVASYTTHHRTK